MENDTGVGAGSDLSNLWFLFYLGAIASLLGVARYSVRRVLSGGASAAQVTPSALLVDYCTLDCIRSVLYLYRSTLKVLGGHAYF